MKIEFSCQRCGKLVSLSSSSQSKARCPHCRKLTEVPSEIASLPHPHVAPTENTASPPEFACSAVEASAADAAIGRIMPWVISLFLHVGVALIMMFIAMIVVNEPLVGRDTPGPVDLVDVMDQPIFKAEKSFNDEGIAQDKTSSAAPRRSIEVKNDCRPGSSPIKLNLTSSDSDGLDGVDIIGDIGKGTDEVFPPPPPEYGCARHIVFLIDRSGSMVETFDSVRMAMVGTIGFLSERQSFHVIFFASGKPLENHPKRMVNATDDRKVKVAAFLESEKIIPVGRTDPMPALRRAFKVLGSSRLKGPKLIHLLTDGVFPRNDKVIELIRKMNPKGPNQVHINTILYGYRPAEAVKIMKLIADENKGTYKYVSLDE